LGGTSFLVDKSANIWQMSRRPRRMGSFSAVSALFPASFYFFLRILAQYYVKRTVDKNETKL